MPDPRSLLALALLLCPPLACSSPEETPPVIEVVPYGQWTLVELNGAALATGPGERAPGLSVAPDGKLAGFAGVNRFTGQADAGLLERGQFLAGPLAVTRMAGPPDAMDLETRYLAALGAADHLTADAHHLTLTHDGNVLARFAK